MRYIYIYQVEILLPDVDVSVLSRSEKINLFKSSFNTNIHDFSFVCDLRFYQNFSFRKPCDLIVEGLFAELLKYFHAKVDRKKCNYMLDRDAYFQYPFLRTLPDEGLPAPFLVEGQLM